MSALEKDFEYKTIKHLERLFPGAVVLKTYPNYIQGFPDRLILFEDTWGAFEFKRSKIASVRNNQEYYIQLLNEMSFARFVFPETKKEFFDEIQSAFRDQGPTRIFKRK